MRMKSSKSKKSIAIFLIAIILISVGYAFLQSNLNIIGNSIVKAPKWHIYFTNVVQTEGSVTPTIAPSTSEKTTTSLTWAVTLERPGQFYEFTVDAVNEGTIDAMINTAPESIITSSLTEEQKKYIDYSVTSDGAKILQYTVLEKGTTEKIKVRVAFKEDVNEADLPATAQTISFAYTADYVQADSRAIAKRMPVKYAVQIYGINHDVDAEGNTLGLTFGPAIGEWYSNCYITHTYRDNGNGTYKLVRVKHDLSGETETTTEEELNVTRSEEEKNKYDINIHDMSWSQIAARSESDPTVFTDCMLCGDTKGVILHLNSTIRTSEISTGSATMFATGTASGDVPGYVPDGDGAGILRASVENYYRMWNEAWTVEGGYAASHIRSTLIGKNSKTLNVQPDPYNVEPSNNNAHLTKDTCVYSCIEDSLKNVITAKRVKYRIGEVVKSDIVDKIWLFSYSELSGDDSSRTIVPEGALYEKFADPSSFYYRIYYDNVETYRLYSEVGYLHRVALRGSGVRGASYFPIDEIWSQLYQEFGPTYCGDSPLSGKGLAFGFCIK